MTKIILDPAQTIVSNCLSNLQKQLIKLSQKNLTGLALKSFFSDQFNIKNIYIHGKVGRGKSMLMKRFFDDLPLKKKIYFHFNAFMQAVHKELYNLRKNQSSQKRDLVSLAVKKIIDGNKVLCFDEMQVEDIADAMILRGVFNYFFDNKVVVVVTSNSHPLDLYKDGLQREVFMQFIKETFLKNFQVLNLENNLDYRSQFLQDHNRYPRHYFFPNNAENKKEILDIFIKATNHNSPAIREINLLGRKLIIKNSYKNIALFDFAELCVAELGVADYQVIVREFDLIFLLNIPRLNQEDRNEAKRLILFIDEVYENKTALIISAAARPEDIYLQGVGAESFKRTASRLNEISSKEYWAKSKIGY